MDAMQNKYEWIDLIKAEGWEHLASLFIKYLVRPDFVWLFLVLFQICMEWIPIYAIWYIILIHQCLRREGACYDGYIFIWIVWLIVLIMVLFWPVCYRAFCRHCLQWTTTAFIKNVKVMRCTCTYSSLTLLLGGSITKFELTFLFWFTV
jgi:hypothetical protein